MARKADNKRGGSQSSPLWKKYHLAYGRIAEKVIIGLIVVGAAGSFLMISNPSVRLRVQWALKILSYGKPAADAWYKQAIAPDLIMTLYDGPEGPNYDE